MAWMGQAAKSGAKLAVKYGPQAKLVWDKGGKQAVDAASERSLQQRQRRLAFAKAGTVTDGAVVDAYDHEQRVWIVLSDGLPIDCFPATVTPLADLVRQVDLSRAVSHAEWDARRLRRRAARLRRRVPSEGSAPHESDAEAVRSGRVAAIDLDDAELLLLRHGLLAWDDAAQSTGEVAVMLGFDDMTDLVDQNRRIAECIAAGEELSPQDWRRAQLATEMSFASDVVGSGTRWSETTGLDDVETLSVLRRLQRKFASVHATG